MNTSRLIWKLKFNVKPQALGAWTPPPPFLIVKKQNLSCTCNPLFFLFYSPNMHMHNISSIMQPFVSTSYFKNRVSRLTKIKKIIVSRKKKHFLIFDNSVNHTIRLNLAYLSSSQVLVPQVEGFYFLGYKSHWAQIL